jgi:hypothetical protein
MWLLACSGPGAFAAIRRNIDFAQQQAWVVAVLAAVSLALWLAKRRRFRYACIVSPLLAVHPAWTGSAIHGDCGHQMAGMAALFTVLAFGCVGLQWIDPGRARPIRITLRRLMVSVAIVSVALGIGRNCVLSARFRREYELQRGQHDQMERIAELNGRSTHADWVAACLEVDRHNLEGPWIVTGGRRLHRGRPDSPVTERAGVAYYASLRARYERARMLPFLPLPAEPTYPRPE